MPLACAAMLGAALFARPAQADEIGDSITAVIVIGTIAPSVTLVGNAVVLGVVDRPGLGWPIGGMICGSLGIAGGVALMAGSPQGFGHISKPLMIGGAVLAGISVADVIVSSVVMAKHFRANDTKPPAPTAWILPVPLLEPGGFGAGIGGRF